MASSAPTSNRAPHSRHGEFALTQRQRPRRALPSARTTTNSPTAPPRSATEPKDTRMEPQILRITDVLAATGLGRTTLRRLVKSGDFPAPIRLGGTGSRSVGWRRTEIQASIDERPSNDS